MYDSTIDRYHNADRHGYNYCAGAHHSWQSKISQPSRLYLTALSLELFLQSGEHVVASGARADFKLLEARQLSKPFG